MTAHGRSPVQCPVCGAGAHPLDRVCAVCGAGLSVAPDPGAPQAYDPADFRPVPPADSAGDPGHAGPYGPGAGAERTEVWGAGPSTEPAGGYDPDLSAGYDVSASADGAPGPHPQEYPAASPAQSLFDEQPAQPDPYPVQQYDSAAYGADAYPAEAYRNESYFDEVSDSSGRGPGGGALAPLLVLASVAAIAVFLFFLIFRGGGDSQEASGSTTAGPAPTSQEPEPSEEPTAEDTPTPEDTPREIERAGSAENCGSGAWRGNDVTSCPFAVVTGRALTSVETLPTEVTVRSPVTKKKYRMSCEDTDPVVCRGGNDAVVYVDRPQE